MGASVLQLFVRGLYSPFWGGGRARVFGSGVCSPFWGKVPAVVPDFSPPISWARPLRSPTAIVRRPVGIAAREVHVFVEGSYISTDANVPLPPRVRPPKTYIFCSPSESVNTALPGLSRAVPIDAAELHVLVDGL